MKKTERDAEALFEELKKVAFEAGFNLNDVRMSGRPVLPFEVYAEFRFRSTSYMRRRPSPECVDSFFGG